MTDFKDGKYIEKTNHIIIYNFGKGKIDLDDSCIPMLTLRDLQEKWRKDDKEKGLITYRVESFYKNGKKDGEETIYMNDKKYMTINYKNGIIDGEYIIQDDWYEGSTFYADFKNGTPITYSIYKDYMDKDEDNNRYTSQKLVERGKFVNGLVNGIVEYRNNFEDENGWGFYNSIYGVANYKNGVKHGKEIHFNPDNHNITIFEVNYVNGIKEGLEISYWGNGNLNRIGNYINGECIYWIEYRENGNISMKQKKKGKLIETIVYNRDGNYGSTSWVDTEKIGDFDDIPF